MKRTGEVVVRFLERIRGWRAKESSPADGWQPQEGAANPLAGIHRAAEDAATVTERVFGDARLIEECLTEIQEQLRLAWQQMSQSSNDYYSLVRDVLLTLDDCRTLGADHSDVSDLTARLEKILRDQGLETIPAAEGDPFDPTIHSCEKTEPSAEQPPGTVLCSLAVGYRRRLKTGHTVVVRPAKVVVSKSPVQSEESKK